MWFLNFVLTASILRYSGYPYNWYVAEAGSKCDVPASTALILGLQASTATPSFRMWRLKILSEIRRDSEQCRFRKGQGSRGLLGWILPLGSEILPLGNWNRRWDSELGIWALLGCWCVLWGMLACLCKHLSYKVVLMLRCWGADAGFLVRVKWECKAWVHSFVSKRKPWWWWWLWLTAVVPFQ